MATLNMEVLLLPVLYGAIWLWVTVMEQSPEKRLRRSMAAGVMCGVAMLSRPTVALLPFVLVLLLCWERPRLSWRDIRTQGSSLLVGVAVPVLLLLLRHRVAWGHWTLGKSRGSLLSWQANYAWSIHDQHPAAIGFGPWLQMVASEPSVIWQKMIPDWWAQMLYLWTHYGFGQMDLVQGLNAPGFYRAALTGMFAASVLIGMLVALQRRTRADLILCALPAYVTGLALVYYVINTRYRAPFIPALYLLACVGFSTFLTTSRARVTPASGRGSMGVPPAPRAFTSAR
jgi:4-amino-4-deoxy-L-arabinose transferase-like glycosyltransferase